MLETFANRLKKFSEDLDRQDEALLETPQERFAPLHAKLYKVVKVMNDEKKDVAFGLTEMEAEQILLHVRKRLSRYTDPNEEGIPYFEMTEAYPEKETV